MDTYKPFDKNKEGSLWPCKGLSSLVSGAKRLGYDAVVDFGEDYALKITSKTVRRAVHEVDIAWVRFYEGSEYKGSIMVIPSNDGDWLSDYTTQEWLDKLIHETVY
ncbi:MAG: hypothetical protein DRH08_05815 [Deltaproteobacteria bacterium]|nr:MAG: hypothetical protein DRH08_05815 [Deltaproteobacteria bacterium]